MTRSSRRSATGDRGAVLLLAVLLTAALAAICQALLLRATDEVRQARIDVETVQAFHAADAALPLCLARRTIERASSRETVVGNRLTKGARRDQTGQADGAESSESAAGSENAEGVEGPASAGLDTRTLRSGPSPTFVFGSAGSADCASAGRIDAASSSNKGPIDDQPNGEVVAVIGSSPSGRASRMLQLEMCTDGKHGRHWVWLDPVMN
ncbi:hypothetical protein [Chitinasiproducens palmae]|uniref:Uncharacterized protein n=1 Tax=Chitinasiproducens palmae TaxID=1770053 RepID=A0A1H2PSY1_9BURK|nr:hypothetical protein [Chitinasiproducens palmae]SDV50146.1 hypothetical protein SAMN05216551_110159 [Chitinasiproducens palmae]